MLFPDISNFHTDWNSANMHIGCIPNSYSAIHKAAGLTVPGRSMIWTGTIPVEHKSVHWLSMGAPGRNHFWGAFQSAALGNGQ